MTRPVEVPPRMWCSGNSMVPPRQRGASSGSAGRRSSDMTEPPTPGGSFLRPDSHGMGQLVAFCNASCQGVAYLGRGRRPPSCRGVAVLAVAAYIARDLEYAPMTVMLAKIYATLKAAGVSEEQAQAA